MRTSIGVMLFFLAACSVNKTSRTVSDAGLDTDAVTHDARVLDSTPEDATPAFDGSVVTLPDGGLCRIIPCMCPDGPAPPAGAERPPPCPCRCPPLPVE